MSESGKQIEELVFLEDIFYYEEHTWARTEGGLIRVGITDFAQDQLGDIIFIELPSPAKHLPKESRLATRNPLKRCHRFTCLLAAQLNW